MATDTPSTVLDAAAELAQRLTELEAALIEVCQLALELPGLADEVCAVFTEPHAGEFFKPDDSFLLAQAMREFPDKAEALALQVSELAVEMDRVHSITRAIGNIGTMSETRDSRLEAQIEELLPLDRDDYQALLHVRTIRAIGEAGNITAVELDLAHAEVESLEAQETFSVLVDAAEATLRRATEQPNKPLPAATLDALRAVKEMVA